MENTEQKMLRIIITEEREQMHWQEVGKATRDSTKDFSPTEIYPREVCGGPPTIFKSCKGRIPTPHPNASFLQVLTMRDGIPAVRLPFGQFMSCLASPTFQTSPIGNKTNRNYKLFLKRRRIKHSQQICRRRQTANIF